MLTNLFYKLRSKLQNKKSIETCLKWKFFLKTQIAFLRGLLFRLQGIILQRGPYRPFLADPNLNILILEGASICLEGQNSIPNGEHPRNPFSHTASSIGLVPYWTYLNPPTNIKTHIRLQAHSKLRMGPNTLISRGSYISIWPNQELYLEGNNYIGHGSYINTRMGLKIGKNTVMGHNVTIMDYDGHPILFKGQTGNADSYGGKSKPISIGTNVWIGFGATILKGVSIGDGSIIGAKACVVKDVPPNCIVAGNPAKVIRENITWRQF